MRQIGIFFYEETSGWLYEKKTFLNNFYYVPFIYLNLQNDKTEKKDKDIQRPIKVAEICRRKKSQTNSKRFQTQNNIRDRTYGRIKISNKKSFIRNRAIPMVKNKCGTGLYNLLRTSQPIRLSEIRFKKNYSK